MASRNASKQESRNTSEIMRKVSSSDTTPELILRQALRAQKLCYRVNNPNLPGRPDIVFLKARVAIFVDGDFWHGGQWRRRKLAALEEQFTGNKNREYWLKKIRRNMERDCKVTANLIARGWTVLRFWERDILGRLEECVQIIVSTLKETPDLRPLSVIPRRTVAEFFAGIGLMRMGLEKEGWSVSFANDLDAEKRRMYEGHFGQSERFHEGDIHLIPGGAIPDVTLATASFPCNDLSLAGARRGLSGKQSSAFWGFIRIIGEMGERKPPFVLLENVVGFLSSHGGDDFKEALGALNNLGYQVDAFILDAARFLPQSRKRLFVLGVLDKIGEAESTSLERDGESGIRPKPLMDFIRTHPEIQWKIRYLPESPKRGIDLADIVEEIPEESDLWWSPERAAYLFGQMSPRHQAVALRMMNRDEYEYGTVFRRVREGESRAELRTDGVAGCLRTPRGGSGRQILFKAGKGRYFVRLLTPRECARLMGADDYRITVPLNQALFGFGDAVCVPVIQWIAKYYLNPLVGELLRGRPIVGDEGLDPLPSSKPRQQPTQHQNANSKKSERQGNNYQK